MIQNTIVKPALSQPIFPLNLRNVNEIFPGFALGDFAVLQGSSVSSLTSLLCVKSQLPTQLGGLQSNVIFIDGGNTFGLYQIARLAQLCHLNPKQVLDNIYISRAFTAYQATSLIMHHLKESIKKYNAKLVIISDIAGFFLDKDIPEDEAQRYIQPSHDFSFKLCKRNPNHSNCNLSPTPKHHKKQLPPNPNKCQSKRCSFSKKNKLFQAICFRKTSLPILKSCRASFRRFDVGRFCGG